MLAAPHWIIYEQQEGTQEGEVGKNCGSLGYKTVDASRIVVFSRKLARVHVRCRWAGNQGVVGT